MIIKPIPDLPKEIKDAVVYNNLVLFIGAGVLRIKGCKGWNELARTLIDLCFTKTKKGKIGTCINYKEKESLCNNTDQKKIITICYEILKKNGYEEEFYKEMEKSFEGKSDLDIYEDLYYLRAINITTNADEHFDKYFKNLDIHYDFDHNIVPDIKCGKLYKIHGTITKRDSLVFTVSQYFNRYKDPNFKDFLENIFKGKYTVLFIGYGLSEFELLDFLFTKTETAIEKRMFILMPFYLKEDSFLEIEKNYYETNLGIQIVPYAKDEKGYNQLYDVIKEWRKKITESSNFFKDRYKDIDNLIYSNDIDKLKKMISLVRQEIHLQEYLFHKLTLVPDPIDYFNYLYEEDFFNSANSPEPIEDKERPGFYSVKNWEVNGFLENVADYNNKKPNEEITNTIISIIDDIISSKDDTIKTDNYKTDETILKLIYSLPMDKIKDEYVVFLKIALGSRFGWPGFISDVLMEKMIPKLIDYKEKEKMLIILDIITDYKTGEYNNVTVVKELFDGYWLGKIGKEFAKRLSELCGIDAVKILKNRIAELIELNYELARPFSMYRITTLKDAKSNSYSDKYESALVFLIRDLLLLTKKSETYDLIKKLLLKEEDIFRRLGYYVINKRYDEYKDLFWENISLNDFNIKREVFELIEENCKKFSKEEIDILVKRIEMMEKREYESENDLVFRKKEWLYALKELNEEDIQEKVRKYEILNHVETTPEYVGKIYLELLENNEYPIYKDTDILELIRKIYDGDKENALHICRIYLSQGYLFVQDLLDELDK